MKKSLFVLSAAAAVLAGCQQENFSAFKADKADFSKGIKAVIAADETRTSVVADGDVYHVNWVSGDQILLQCGDMRDYYLTEESGKPAASFYRTSGDSILFDGVTPVQAFFPASYFAKSSGAIALPATQGYSANGIYNNPMYAEANPDPTAPAFEFKNLCGVLKINATSTVAGAAVKSIALKADQGMSGILSVIDGAAVVDGTTGVTLLCDQAVALSSTPTAFYFAIPADNYTNLEITVTTADAKKQTLKMKADKTLNIERSKIYEADFAFDKFEDSGLTLGGICTLGPGRLINAVMKAEVDPHGTFTSGDTNQNTCFVYGATKIVFSPRDFSTVGVDISDPTSDCYAYASYNSATRTLTISTTADEFQLGADGTFIFSGFYDLQEVVGLDKLTTANCENMSYMFYRCDNIEGIDCGSFNTENVTDMQYMFAYCRKAKSINVKSFDTSNVTTFKYFLECNWELTDIDVSNFDTSSATILTQFFDECLCIKNLDLSNWDTTSATSLYSMFWGMRDLETLKLGDNFDITSNPTIDYMFGHCCSLREVWFPECFLPANLKLPNAFFTQSSGSGENWSFHGGFYARTSCWAGSLTIHCTQETADWLAKTNLRWLPSGYNTAMTCDPIPVKFLDRATGQELAVTWAPN